MQRADVGVIQRGDGAGFALEAFAEPSGRDLDGDAAVKPGVGGAENASHAALAERRLDPVRAEHRRAAGRCRQVRWAAEDRPGGWPRGSPPPSSRPPRAERDRPRPEERRGRPGALRSPRRAARSPAIAPVSKVSDQHDTARAGDRTGDIPLVRLTLLRKIAPEPGSRARISGC